VGRPHVARALSRLGLVTSEQDAFDRYLGWGRPAHVPKQLPALRDVARVVHEAGGVVSAAHLKERGTRSLLTQLRGEGLDAVEVRHPTHPPDLQARLTEHARALGLRCTGGSDWHGESPDLAPGGRLGGQEVPPDWLDLLEAARPG
jgi:predicted metal-dependent phosphoesterase TrpH